MDSLRRFFLHDAHLSSEKRQRFVHTHTQNKKDKANKAATKTGPQFGTLEHITNCIVWNVWNSWYVQYEQLNGINDLHREINYMGKKSPGISDQMLYETVKAFQIGFGFSNYFHKVWEIKAFMDFVQYR